MIIRLTSVLAFEKVLDKLKKSPDFDAECNAAFFKYCVPSIKEGIERGDDEWYLDVDRLLNVNSFTIILRYHRRSDELTDEKYLTDIEE